MAPRTSTIVYRARTPYQNIVVRRDRRGLLLMLNGSPQVHTAEEAAYHECIATVPLLLARNVADVAILGGGDGLAARNVLDVDGVRRCWLVELDPGVLALCSRWPLWRRVNAGSLTDRRLAVIAGDAIRWIGRQRRRFDVIINDVEVTYTRQPKALTIDRVLAFYDSTYAHLKPGGVMLLTVADDTDERLPDGVFQLETAAGRIPPEAQRVYRRLTGPVAKVRFLLAVRYRHLTELTIAPRTLGSHTTFYVSNAPLTRLRRRPPMPLSLSNVEARLFA